jgi:hypothetical protein
MKMPKDIEIYMHKKFGPGSDPELWKLKKLKISSAIDPDHLIRCIVFLSNNIPDIDEWIKKARIDPRDLIMEAEYVTNGLTGEPQKVRDLSMSFEPDPGDHTN